MSPSSSPRGTAEELERVLAGVATPEEAARHERLVRTVGLLTEHRAVTPRPQFSTDLRARLMAAAETELVPDRTAVVRALRPVTPARRRLGSVAASLVIVGASAGVAAAADRALPGEALYPVKRGTEQVSTALRVGEAREGRALLDQAATRLDEAERLAEREADPRLVTGALRDFRVAAADGSARLFSAYRADQRDTDVASVRDFAAEQMGALTELSKGADPVVAASLVDAADVLAGLDQEARVLCPGCGGEELVTPDAVAAGAGAATVDALLTRPVSQARVDREAVAALELSELRELADLAQASAGRLGQGEELQRSVAPVEVDQHGPVASTLTTGPTRPAGSDRPVRDLVTGVTGTLTGVTGTVRTTLPQTETVVDDIVEDLDDTVTGVTGELLP